MIHNLYEFNEIEIIGVDRNVQKLKSYMTPIERNENIYHIA